MTSDQKSSAKPEIHPVILKTMEAGSKVVPLEEAIQLIQDGDTIATGGFVGIAVVEEILIGIEEYFLQQKVVLVHQAPGYGQVFLKGSSGRILVLHNRRKDQG